MVKRVEIYHYYSATPSADARFAPKQCGQSIDLTDFELGHSDGFGILWRAGINCHNLCIYGIKSEQPCRDILHSERAIQQHNLLLACQCNKCWGHECLVERLGFYDDSDSGAGSAGACVALKQCGQPVNLTDPELEYGDGCGDLYGSGIKCIEFWFDGIQPDGSHGSFHIGKRSI